VLDGVREGVRDGGERLQALARQGVLPPTPVTAAALLVAHVARQVDAPPPDHPLYRQAYDGLRQLDPQKLGLRAEQEYRNAAGALAAGARRGGLQRIDHVLANRDGSGLFVVQGAPHDPAHQRIHLDKAQAALQPLAQSLQQLQQASVGQAEHDLAFPPPQAARGMPH
jgi:putative chitinase